MCLDFRVWWRRRGNFLGSQRSQKSYESKRSEKERPQTNVRTINTISIFSLIFKQLPFYIENLSFGCPVCFLPFFLNHFFLGVRILLNRETKEIWTFQALKIWERSETFVFMCVNTPEIGRLGNSQIIDVQSIDWVQGQICPSIWTGHQVWNHELQLSQTETSQSGAEYICTCRSVILSTTAK